MTGNSSCPINPYNGSDAATSISEPATVSQRKRTANRNTNVRPGEEYVSTNVDMEEGGGSISYPTEDPMIRKIYQEELAKEGAEFTMPEEMFVSR